MAELYEGRHGWLAEHGVEMNGHLVRRIRGSDVGRRFIDTYGDGWGGMHYGIIKRIESHYRDTHKINVGMNGTEYRVVDETGAKSSGEQCWVYVADDEPTLVWPYAGASFENRDGGWTGRIHAVEGSTAIVSYHGETIDKFERVSLDQIKED